MRKEYDGFSQVFGKAVSFKDVVGDDVEFEGTEFTVKVPEKLEESHKEWRQRMSERPTFPIEEKLGYEPEPTPEEERTVFHFEFEDVDRMKVVCNGEVVYEDGDEMTSMFWEEEE